MYLVRRMAGLTLVLVGAATTTFIVTRLIGNPVYLLVGQQTSPEIVNNLIHEMGLDRPLYVQYFRYLASVAQGNLGISRYTHRLVLDDLALRLPATLELVALALVMIVIVGFPLGVFAAMRRDGWIDRAAGALSQIGSSLPNFWVGLVLIYLGFYLFSIFPAPLGRLEEGIAPPARLTGLLLLDSVLAGDRVAFASALRHLLLPAMALALGSLPPTVQIVRNSFAEALSSDFMRTARAYGLGGTRTFYKYGLKNILVPASTVLAMTFGFLMSGTVLVETVFSWPGLGLYAVDSMVHFDYEPIIGVVLLSALFYALAYFVSDLVHFAVDPRIRRT